MPLFDRYRQFRIPEAPVRMLPALLVLNVVVYLAWQVAGAAAVLRGDGLLGFMEGNFLVSAAHLFDGRVWTLLTSELSHNALPHLFFNMFALWLFGADVERIVGARGFLHLYVAGGVAASLGHVLFMLVAGTTTPALGASGAVMAVAVTSALLFPDRLLLVFFILPMPQILAVGLFVLIDIVGMLSPSPNMIAHAAHLGGAAYGWLYYRRSVRHYLTERLAALGLLRRPPATAWTHPPA